MANIKAPGQTPLEELTWQVRLLLSWKEQVLRLQAAAEANHTEPAYNRERFRSFGEYGAANLHEAAARLNRLREREHAHLSALAAELRAALKSQSQILQQAKPGSLSAGKANRKNRGVARRIGKLRAEIAQYNRLFSAKKSTDLGAFIHLPLEKYAHKIEHPRKPLFTSFSKLDRGAIVAAGVLIILIALAGLYYVFGREQVRFAAHPDARGTQIKVTCMNDTRHTISLCVPWPLDPIPGNLRSAYGVEVYVRLRGEDGYRRLSSNRGLWTYQGRPTEPGTPLRVRPRLSDEIALDLSGVDGVERVRLICSKGNGSEIDRFAFDITRGT